MSTKNLLFQESLPPRIPNPIFIVLMMDSKKGLDEYLNIFDESPLKELDFRYFEFLTHFGNMAQRHFLDFDKKYLFFPQKYHFSFTERPDLVAGKIGYSNNPKLLWKILLLRPTVGDFHSWLF